MTRLWLALLGAALVVNAGRADDRARPAKKGGEKPGKAEKGDKK